MCVVEVRVMIWTSSDKIEYEMNAFVLQVAVINYKRMEKLFEMVWTCAM